MSLRRYRYRVARHDPTAALPMPADLPGMRAAVLAWYAARGRDLAFRGTSDPYAILVAEAMAQQTQAARAADYWARFLVEFPTVQALAEATPAAVIRAWRGLGYNRRALALRDAAVAIVRDHGGRVPSDVAALERLPGVGPYTARAVAALAFGRSVGAVDVNVRRVLSRVVGGSIGALAPRRLQEVADAIVPGDAPGTWTHALMDIGASLCRLRAPRCEACPAQRWCRHARSGGAGERAATPARGPRSDGHGAREAPAAFETTSRWLRGRILDLLRDAPGSEWASIPSHLGSHAPAAVLDALRILAREGLAELHPAEPDRARLPIG